MSVTLRMPPRGGGRVTVEVLPASLRAPAEAVEARWRAMSAANPRLFDGPVLALDSIDLDAGIIRARRESYKWLAVQPDVPMGVEQLSVTGVITARDGAGAAHILMGRRGARTRIHGGLWEFAPSGGLDPPVPGVGSMSWDDLLAQVKTELMAETGLTAPLQGARLLCIAHDAAAASADLVIAAEVGPPPADLPLAGANWEYSEAVWLPVSRVPEFVRAEAVIGTSLAVMGQLGWR